MAGNGGDKLKILGHGNLLDDGSMEWNGYDRTDLLRAVHSRSCVTRKSATR